MKYGARNDYDLTSKYLELSVDKGRYYSPLNKIIDMIMKRGGKSRYEAEALFNAWWRLNDRNPQKVAELIAAL